MTGARKNRRITPRTATVVLVGTYRRENASWIKERRLYNLPLPKIGKTAFHGRISRIVLIAAGFENLAYEAKLREVVDGEWLKKNGYKVARKGEEHGEAYALYELGKPISVCTALSDRSADVFVSSQRCPSVRIDAAFYEKSYPQTGGKSMHYIFDQLKPYFKKWHSAVVFNPVQGDLFAESHGLYGIGMVEANSLKRQMDYFELEGKQYPARQIELGGDWGDVVVSVESLNDALFDDTTGLYVSDAAKMIDEEIFFFVRNNEIGSPSELLAEKILKEVA